MITTEEIKKVEKLQKIEHQIEILHEDYLHAKHKNIGFYNGYDYESFYRSHNKELARIINHKILKLKRKRKELLNGK